MVSTLLVLVGSPLVRAGQERRVVAIAGGWSVLFAASVVLMLLRWPDWMYAYLASAERIPPRLVALPFLAGVAGAGFGGATLAAFLVARGRAGWALASAAVGVAIWALIGVATWDEYAHVGSYAAYHAGIAPPIAEVPEFERWMTGMGTLQAVTGLGAAAYLIVRGLATRRRRVRRDPIRTGA